MEHRKRSDHENANERDNSEFRALRPPSAERSSETELQEDGSTDSRAQESAITYGDSSELGETRESLLTEDIQEIEEVLKPSRHLWYHGKEQVRLALSQNWCI